jgi:hypothetical protein
MVPHSDVERVTASLLPLATEMSGSGQEETIMAVRAKLFEVAARCTAHSGEVIDIGEYQGTESGRPDLNAPQGRDTPLYTLEHPRGLAIDVTDLVKSGVVVVY